MRTILLLRRQESSFIGRDWAPACARARSAVFVFKFKFKFKFGLWLGWCLASAFVLWLLSTGVQGAA